MSASNNINVIGNLVGEPELRFTSTGTPVCNFRIAVNEQSVVNGERRERTEYLNVVAWQSQAENLSVSLSKGMRVMVNGRIQIRKATIDGEDRFYTEVVASEVGLALRWQQVSRDEVRKHNGKSTELVPAGADPLYDDTNEPF